MEQSEISIKCEEMRHREDRALAAHHFSTMRGAMILAFLTLLSFTAFVTTAAWQLEKADREIAEMER